MVGSAKTMLILVEKIGLQIAVLSDMKKTTFILAILIFIPQLLLAENKNSRSASDAHRLGH